MPTRKTKHSNRLTLRKHISQQTTIVHGPLRSSYGIVILPKGLRLYHASTSSLCKLPDKPVLFMTLHPSEWYSEGVHISVLELQKEVSLLFMVKHIHLLRVISSLNDFLGKQNSNMAKMNYDNIKKWIPNLQQESLDGWFSSIENKMAVEFAVINDSSNLKLIECLPIRYNWKNANYNNDTLIPKQWGNVYQLHSKTMPSKIHVHVRFRPQIEAYKQKIKDEDPYGTAFSVLLDNATISYFDGPVSHIKWAL